MQHIDHDMDDLFRKAAESYPLKTGAEDWDSLAAKLSLTSPVAAVAPKKPVLKYVVVIFLSLLALILSGYYFYHFTTSTKTPKLAGAESLVQSKKDHLFKRNTVAVNKLSKAGRNVFVQKAVAPTAVNEGGLTNNNGSTKVVPQLTVSNTGRVYRHRVKKPISKLNEYASRISIDSRDDGEGVFSTEFLPEHAVAKHVPLVLPFTIFEPTLELTPIKISGGNSQSHKVWYAGLNGGPEFSKVGSQSSTRTGYHAGILIGYQLNSKWSIESGLMVGKNNYYSNGNYFNMNKVASSMPVGMEIMALNGQSTHIEIPVIAKYNFIRNQRSKLFFTGGLLSDVYLQERNDYQTMLNGVKDNQVGLYNQDKFMPASQLRISIGYEHRIGRAGNFRIEPYKNIPLQKTGMGSMAIFSSGFNMTLLHVFGKK